MINVTDLIGIPFVEFGRDKNKGFDCYGLAIEVERRFGKKLNDVVLEKFDRAKVKKTLPEINVKKTEKIKEGAILEFYGINDSRLHIGVALGSDIFIHSTENQGVRISSVKNTKTYMKLANVYEVL